MKRVSLFLLAFLIVSLVLSMYQISEVKANPDESFGYTTIGGDESTLDNHVDGSKFTMGAIGGTGDSITVALREYGGDWQGDVKCAMYLASALSAPITNGVTEERNLALTGSFAWYTFNFPTSPNLLADTDYVLVAWAEDVANTCYFARDADAGVDRWYETHTYNGFPSLSASDRTGKFSIFATYTTAGVQEYSEEFTETVSVSASSHFWRALLYKNIEGITTTATTYTWGEYPCFFSETITTTEEQNEWNELRRFFTETVTIREELVKQLALFRLFTETIGITETSSFATEILVEITEFAETVSIDASLYLWKAKQFMIEEGVIGVADFYKWISLRQFFTETINPTETLQLLREKLLSVTETINTSAFLQALKETLLTIIEFTDIIPFTATMYLTPQKIVPPIEVTTFGTVAFVIAIIALAIAVTAITAKKS